MLSRRQIIGATAAMSVLPYAAHAGEKTAPLIVGHRGAPGYLPEHTIPGYVKAIAMGADFIEPDVVATKDGHLIVRHEPLLSVTTDVTAHPEFADRKRMRVLDGVEVTDFFACDFTLEEIRTLRARQAFADRDHSHDGMYPVVTLQEVIDLAASQSKKVGRVIGVYPETKHPTFHGEIGLALEGRLLEVLGRAGLTSKTSPVIIQSFETANLKALRRKTDVRLMQLVDGSDSDPATGEVVLKAPSDKPYDWVVAGRVGDNRDQLSVAGLAEIAGYADIVAPWKRWLIGFSGGVEVRRPEIVLNAHAAGLKVHTWTMRDDRLEGFYKGDAVPEYVALFDMGVNGVFSDFADTAVKARDVWMAG